MSCRGWRRSIAASLFVLVSAGLGGCARDARGDTIVLASGADLEGMNPLATVHPLSRQLQRFALFVTLTRLDDALAHQPYFAQSWRWSSDRRSLEIRTFSGLQWHDHTPVTARDAAFTLEAARDPATAFPRAAALAALDSAWASDDTLLVLRFRTPQPELPVILAELPIAPRHLLGAVPRAELRRSPFARAPIGCGPFRFVRRDPGVEWRFERDTAFPLALGGPARARGLSVVVIDEPTTKLAGLVSGDLDVAGIAPTMVTQAERDRTLRVLTYPVLFTHALVFNTTRAPFDDPRMRHALSLGINRARIVELALAGQGAATRGPLPPGHPLAEGSDAPGVPVSDTVSADRLLDEVGWRRGLDGARGRNGVPLTLTLRFVSSGDNLIEQLVQADLAARGVRVELRAMELGAFLAEARRPDKRFDLLVTGIPGDLALSHLNAMFEGREAHGPLDYAGYHAATLDSAFARTRAAPSAALQATAWRALLRQLDEAEPVAWLAHARGVQGLSRRVAGVTMDLRGELPTVAIWSRAVSP